MPVLSVLHLFLRVTAYFNSLSASPHRRTFLSWLNFTVVLAGLSIGLLNFGDKVGKIAAGMFTLVAMAVMIYALVTYREFARTWLLETPKGSGGKVVRPIYKITAADRAMGLPFVLRLMQTGVRTQSESEAQDHTMIVSDQHACVSLYLVRFPLRMTSKLCGSESGVLAYGIAWLTYIPSHP